MIARRSLFALLFVAFGAISTLPAAAADIIVFAAASLKNALDDVIAGYHDKTGKTVKASYEGSSTLAKQIEQAAPADIFMSADLAWMDYVANKNLIVTETRKTLLGNELVLVAPKDSSVSVNLASGVDLVTPLGADGHIAMANVDSVPAGKYGKAALTKLGVWDAVSPHVVQADNVRAALAFVARGEAPLGIVYQTDAAAEPAVKIVATFGEDTHPPIVYPVALLTASTNPDAKDFLAYLQSDAAKPAYAKQGFTVLVPGS